MRRRLPALALGSLILGFLPRSASAEDLRSVLTGYSVASWGMADGLPSGEIVTMAQDREGYLWLGTELGLVRFDGFRFATWATIQPDPLPPLAVRALLVSSGGDLWVGFGGPGGVARLRRSPRAKSLRLYAEADGLQPGQITSLIEDHDGTIWASSLAGLFWFAGDGWHQWIARGLPQGPVHATYVASRNRMLVSSSTGVFALRSQTEGFERLEVTPRIGPVLRRGAGPPDDLIGAISVDTRGRMWLADRVAGFRIVDGSATLTAPGESGRGRSLLRDRAGNMWVGTAGQGLWRVKLQPASNRLAVDHSTELTGLLGNGVLSLLEDRDGNIWAGTIEGLNRLTPRQSTVLNGLGLVAGVEVEGQSVWVAASEGVLRFEDASSNGVERLPKATTTAMHADEQGQFWLANANRLTVILQGRRRELTIDDAAPVPSIDLITSDRRGGVWLYDQSRGLLRWNGKTIEKAFSSPELARMPLLWMDTQHDGRLWLLASDGRVAVMSPDGSVREYGRHEGLEGDLYRAMYEDRHGDIWLAGARGLTRFAQGRFRTLTRLNGHPLVNLTAILEDESGSFWVGTSSGVVSFSPDDFDRALPGPANRIPYRLYTSDALAGNPRWYGQRGAIRAADGRLWFVTSRGVTVLDPRVAPAKLEPMPVRIDGIFVDGQSIDPRDQGRLPAGTRRLEVGFSAATLTTPERTHFRYRLDGFDTQWIDVGTRHQAAYTNLPAGDYRFHVMASGSDGTWPISDAVWTFSVAPMFYRTTWFMVSCIFALGMIVVAAWRLHLREVRARFSLLLGERARLSREIHDTLLQGLFGVALRCDAIASELETSPPGVREHFTSMRRDVEEYMREARQSIWNLRSPKLSQLGLSAALRQTGEKATAGRPIGFIFTVEGEAKPCPSAAEEQLVRIGHEAVSNAVQHAQASEIHMELRYENSGVVLTVTDNGLGFDPGRAAGNGHYGLINMRERAETAGGSISIVSGAGHGTRIVAEVPYGRARSSVL